MLRVKGRAFVFLLSIAILFNWKTVLTHQFSLLTLYEGANQAYSWYHFWVSSVRSGNWPFWDPFTFSGHTFVGEMQTGAFYPVNFLLALFPLNDRGLFSPALYHWLYVVTQAAGAFLTYCFGRELKLSTYAALVAGMCFAFGGVESRVSGWPHLFQGFIWLPLLMLFLLRALGVLQLKWSLLYASLSGLCLGMTILAGGLHVALMDGIVIVSAVVYYTVTNRRDWSRAGWVAAAALLTATCAGAVQLLPSIEYGQMAFRFLGTAKMPATERIPYAYLRDGFVPNTLLTLVFANASEAFGPGEVINPYMGVFPLLAAMVGVWQAWRFLWVRYLTGLAVAAFIYAMGAFSFMHGLLYALIPELWMAREANRFMYLADFALAVLAAYGIEALFQRTPEQKWDDLLTLLKWIGIACVAALGATAFFGFPAMKPWNGLSVLLILSAVLLAGYVVRGATGAWSRALVMGLIMFDLGSFDWSALNEIQERAKKSEEMDRLLSCRGAVDFLKTRPGPFRVQWRADLSPNIGDLFGVETTWGAGVTVLQDYERIRGRSDLWNVRYAVRPASATEPRGGV